MTGRAENRRTHTATELIGLSVAHVLRERYPHVSLRSAVRGNPFLDSVTVGDVLADSFSLEEFLATCRTLPNCGETQVARLRAVLEDIAAELGRQGPGVTATPEARRFPDPVRPGADAPRIPKRTAEAPDLALQGQFLPESAASRVSVFERMWRQARFDWFIDLPGALPEAIKTPAVARAETDPVCNAADPSAETRIEREMLAALHHATGLVLVDSRALNALFHRAGRYSALSEQEVAEQGARIDDMLRVHPGQVDMRVIDYDAAQMSRCMIVGDMVCSRTMGGYFLTRDREFSEILALRCMLAGRGAPAMRAELCRIRGAISADGSHRV